MGPTPQHPLFAPLLQHMKWPSVSTLDVAPEDAATSAASPSPTPGGFARTHRRSASCGSAFPSPQSGIPASDCRIIRARMGLSNGSLYKSVLVSAGLVGVGTELDMHLSCCLLPGHKHRQVVGLFLAICSGGGRSCPYLNHPKALFFSLPHFQGVI